MSAANITHGARSEPTLKRRAMNKKRTLLRQLGLRQEQLDGIGRALLADWSRSAAIVELYFEFGSERGWLDDDGNPPGFSATYWAATNSSRLTLVKLAEHLKKTGKVEQSMVAALQAQARGADVVPIRRAER